MPGKLRDWFSADAAFEGCRFLTEFPEKNKVSPVKDPVVIFGAKSMSVLPNTVDQSGSVITEDRIAEFEITVKIHAPKTKGGDVCLELLDKITDLLLFNSTIAIEKVKSEPLEYLRDTDSLCLRAVVTARETLKPGDSYGDPLTA